jgi:CheY-like chemotaxis protein
MPRVLVVDDDPGVRSGLRRILVREFGVEVIEAGDGVKALETLVRQPCDLVLLDMKMPVLDGLRTLQAVRRSPDHGALPVLMLTGTTDAGLVREAARLGVAGYLVKPVEPRLLLERVGEALARAAAEPAPAVPPVVAGEERAGGPATARRGSRLDTCLVAAVKGLKRELALVTDGHVVVNAALHVDAPGQRRWASASQTFTAHGARLRLEVLTPGASAGELADFAARRFGNHPGSGSLTSTLRWLASAAAAGLREETATTAFDPVACEPDIAWPGHDGRQPTGAERWLMVATTGILVLVRVAPE